jgi:hypothetical protein
MTSISSNQVTPRGTEQMTLEAYVMVKRYQVNVLFDTGTMGDNLIFGKFVSKKGIAIENLKVPISLKTDVKGSRSTITYKVKPVV